MVFKRATKSKQIKQVGMSISSQGIAVVCLEKAEGRPRMTTCQFHPATKKSEYTRALSELVSTHTLEDAQVVCVLSPDKYDLFLIERPDVSDVELLGAVRWRVKDYVEYGIDEAVVDFIPLPGKSIDVKGTMGYAVVSKQKVIDELVQLAKSAGLSVMAVDIAEAAMCKLASLSPLNDEGLVYIRLSTDASQLIVMKKGTLSLMRNIDIHRQFLFDDLSDDNETHREKLVADIVLEVQRSLDYCTTNLRQEGVNHVALAPTNDLFKLAITNLSEELGGDANIMYLEDIISFDAKMSDLEQSQCLLAVGGALRALEGLS